MFTESGEIELKTTSSKSNQWLEPGLREIVIFGETTGIAEILRSLKRTHFVPIINDVFNRSF